ncbi:MAG: HIT family protein [Candidatus Aenigmatarchaeota archaeon]
MKKCKFCNIIKYKNDYVIFENKNTIAILDNKPLSKGHLLIIPKKHYESLLDVPASVFVELFKTAYKISLKVCKILNADSVNIALNSGYNAGQSVNHFHIHVLPRYHNDKMQIIVVNKNSKIYKKNLSKIYNILTQAKLSL